MGLFGKLFEKKVCDICGEEIGLLGNRKLEDGNCCKACAAKLSPWFYERRESTVEEIRQQLAYREANRGDVAAFHVTRSFGTGMKVLLDEDAGRFMVTRARDLKEANPDVLRFDQVTGCELEVREDRDEVYRETTDSEGNREEVSYSPRRYRYSYEFLLHISVNHPYFDSIDINLSDGSIDVEKRSGFGPEGSTTPPTEEERRADVEYARFEQMGADIREALTRARSEAREEAAAAAAPRQKLTCPWCGATTEMTESGCCEYCGGSLRG